MKVMRELISIKMMMKLLARIGFFKISYQLWFSNWVVLNLLDKEKADLNIIRTARGVISLSFCCGVKLVNIIEVPQYVKFTCTRSEISGSLGKIGWEYGLQPGLLKGEVKDSENTKRNHNELRHIWEPYLQSDALCLAYAYARRAM